MSQHSFSSMTMTRLSRFIWLAISTNSFPFSRKFDRLNAMSIRTWISGWSRRWYSGMQRSFLARSSTYFELRKDRCRKSWPISMPSSSFCKHPMKNFERNPYSKSKKNSCSFTGLFTEKRFFIPIKHKENNSGLFEFMQIFKIPLITRNYTREKNH